MLQSALALISSFRIGRRIKEGINRALRQAIVIAIAIVLLITAALFGLLSAYHALVSFFGFTPLQASGIEAAVFTLLGLLVLAALPLFAPKPKRQEPTVMASASEAMGVVDRGVGKTMRQFSPVTMLAIAFIAGVLASRR
jgi:hypothetical protein